MLPHQYVIQQEQQRREEVERQLYYTAASLEEMRRQLMDLQSVYQQQSLLLEHERQQRAALVEQLKQQQTMLAESEKKQQKVNKQQQLIKRVNDEVKRFQDANKTSDFEINETMNNPNNDFDDSMRDITFVPSDAVPTPNKHAQVDWSLDYSVARLEDMMEEPESLRNALYYALLRFHSKRLEALIGLQDDDDQRYRDYGGLINRVNEELTKTGSFSRGVKRELD